MGWAAVIHRTAIKMDARDLLNLTARVAGRPTGTQMRDQPAEKQKRGQKYGNQKVLDQGEKFDSKAEHKRWLYLVMLQKAGEIRNLQRQAAFELIPAMPRPSGGSERATKYLADFTYERRDGRKWVKVVEDVKGAVTPEFRLKRKLMLHVHGIEVQEIRS